MTAVLLKYLHKNQIRGRADRGADAAHTGRVSQPQQQRHGEALALIGAVENRQGDRQQHQRRGGIGYPHAQQCGSGHKTQHQTARAAGAEQANQAQSQAPVSAAGLQRLGQ